MLKRVLLFTGMIACSSSALALHLGDQNTFYVGANTGASFVTNQSFDHYYGNGNGIYSHELREESSARGYNGGLSVGYNFYCDCNTVVGLELSGNIYSNRGHYTDHFYNAYYSQYHNFDFSHDMQYSYHLTVRPGYLINPCTIFYFNIGVGYAKVNFRAENKLNAVNGGSYPSVFESDDHQYGLTLGAGLQKKLTNCISVFAEYQYTHYGEFCTGNVRLNTASSDTDEGEGEGEGEREGLFQGEYNKRGAVIDTNVFKMGVMFTF